MRAVIGDRFQRSETAELRRYHFETMPCVPIENETTMSRSNDEQNAVFFGDIQIENLVTMPENTSEFVTMQGRMPPVC